jgi:NitT/TauT family transport system ATP-binding protein
VQRVEEVKERARPTTAVDGIVLQGVRKVFGQGEDAVIAVDGVDLEFGAGEFVSIVGPSGCGKSTLLRLIVGLTPVSAGRISIFGRPVQGPVTDCGIVFQQPVLLDWRTVIDNVLFNIDMRGLDPAAYRPKAEALLETVGLGEFMTKPPYELSGGMTQRAAIARALVHEPPL